MVNVDQIKDITTLRQIIRLQEVELSRATARIEKLVREMSLLQGKDPDKSLQEELFKLQDRVNRLQHLMFGKSSERRHGPPSGTPETDKSTPEGSAFPHSTGDGEGAPPDRPERRKDGKPRRKGHGPTPQPALPLEIREHDLDLPDKMCPSCGGNLQEMTGQFEESEEIDVIERRYIRVLHRRKKYRCTCNACVETALGEPRLIPGGRYSIRFGVHVAVEKFSRHDPLTRQTADMLHQGLVVSDQTLFDLLTAIAKLGEPTALAIRSWLLQQKAVHVDETSWKMMKRDKTQSWWMFSVSNRLAAYFKLARSRSGETISGLLAGFDGVAVTDGLENYGTAQRLQIARMGKSFELAGCWSHIRRAVLAGRAAYAKESTEFLDLIDALFKIERKASTLAREGPSDRSPEQVYEALLEHRARLRESESRPLIESLRQKVLHTAVLPTSAMGRAIGYMNADWKKLTLFLTHPEVELSNNPAERQLRVPVLGRVNYRGNISENGAWVTSILYTLLQTAKLARKNPEVYLETLVRHALANPGDVLLPWDMPDD